MLEGSAAFGWKCYPQEYGVAQRTHYWNILGRTGEVDAADPDGLKDECELHLKEVRKRDLEEIVANGNGDGIMLTQNTVHIILV